MKATITLNIPPDPSFEDRKFISDFYYPHTEKVLYRANGDKINMHGILRSKLHGAVYVHHHGETLFVLKNWLDIQSGTA